MNRLCDAASTPVSIAAIRAICRRHRLPMPSPPLQPWIGATSTVFPLGETVLKVPHPTADAVAALERDVLVAPLARAAGIATPNLIVFDETRDLLLVPYAVMERIQGSHIAKPVAGVPVDTAAWQELGRQLALVHTRVDAEPIRPRMRSFVQSPEVDPRPWVDALVVGREIAPETAKWLRDTFDRLAPAALAPLPLSFCHGDVNAANVLVAEDRRLVLIDWSGTGWLDPVWDFVGVPLSVVPEMLSGHREIAPVVSDETAEARILWCFLQSGVDRLYQHEMSPSEAAAQQWLQTARRFAERVGL